MRLARGSTAGARATAFKVALSGGPGGGKTTAADLFRREIGERVIVVPEAATILYAGGFPREVDGLDAAVADDAREALQRAIFEVQQRLEQVQSARYPDRFLLCDRGTVDSAAYWPAGPQDFFARVGTTHQAELARYDAVLFFETAAVGGFAIEGGNRYRVESNEEAVVLDGRLRELWAPHPRFHFVAHQRSFLAKVTAGLAVLESLMADLWASDVGPQARPGVGEGAGQGG